MIIAALLLAGSQPAESPVAFIHQAYAGYRHSGYSPLLHPDRLFSPALTAAIRKDGSGGEVGYLDGDPLCDCQDFERLSAKILSIRRQGTRAAAARIHVTLGPGATRDIKLNLVRTHAGWRISDVIDPRGHSLLEELRRSNAGR